MSATDDKLAQILNSPESLGKIAEIAKSLSQTNKDASNNTADTATAEITENNTDSNPVTGHETESEIIETAGFGASSLPDLNGILSQLKISPAVANTLGSAVQGFNENEKRIALLKAVKPFSHGKNGDTLERAILAIKIARAAKLLIGNL